LYRDGSLIGVVYDSPLEQETVDQQLVVEEEYQDEMTVLLNAEVAKIKLELEQRMKAQEEEILRPFKGRKK
jgi:hypothetical protein